MFMCSLFSYRLPLHNLVSPLAGEIWFSSSVLMGLLLFGLSVFFFAFGILPYWSKVHKHLGEILGCQHLLFSLFTSVYPDLWVCILDVGWALTFPNVGWISTLRVLGDTLQIPGFYVLHAIMAILMCMVWVVLFGLTAVAFWKGKIFFATEADVLRDENRTTDNRVV